MSALVSVVDNHNQGWQVPAILDYWYVVLGLCAAATVFIKPLRESAKRACRVIVLWAITTDWKHQEDEMRGVTDKNEEMFEMVREMRDCLLGPEPTKFNPTPQVGIIELVGNHDEFLKKLDKKVDTLLGNGGNTDSTGDLVLKLAKQAGVTESQREENA